MLTTAKAKNAKPMMLRSRDSWQRADRAALDFTWDPSRATNATSSGRASVRSRCPPRVLADEGWALDQARILALVSSQAGGRPFVHLAKRRPMREQNGKVDLRLIRCVGCRMLLIQPPL